MNFCLWSIPNNIFLGFLLLNIFSWTTSFGDQKRDWSPHNWDRFSFLFLGTLQVFFLHGKVSFFLAHQEQERFVVTFSSAWYAIEIKCCVLFLWFWISLSFFFFYNFNCLFPIFGTIIVWYVHSLYSSHVGMCIFKISVTW